MQKCQLKTMFCRRLFHRVFADTSAAPAVTTTRIEEFTLQKRDMILCQDPEDWVTGILLAVQHT